MQITARSEGLVDNLHLYSFHILGCGAIGSSAAMQLARMGATSFYLYAMDIVEDVNIGVSQYNRKHLAMSKVDALEEIIQEINIKALVDPVMGLFTEYYYSGPNDIAILGYER